MKKLILLLLILNYSCKDNPETEPVPEVKDIESRSTSYSISVTDTDKTQFEEAALHNPVFDNFTNDTIPDPSVRRPDLTIETGNGKLSFRNINPSLDTIYTDDQEVNYYDLGFSKDTGKHLVQASYYEGDDFLLIDHKTGRTDTINGMPHYSPQMKRMISFYNNPYSEREIDGEFVSTGDVEIYSVSNDSLKTIATKSFDFIPVEIRWKDENTILIKAVSSLDYAKMSRTPGATTDSIKNFIYKQITINVF